MNTNTGGGAPQLSLFVAKDTRIAFHDGAPVATAAIKLGKDLVVRRDFNPGEELTVTVTDSKGQDVAAGLYVVESVGFVPIKGDGVVMGTERVHKTSLEDGDLLAPSLDPNDPRNAEAA